jgi:hypothetical protein
MSEVASKQAWVWPWPAAVAHRGAVKLLLVATIIAILTAVITTVAIRQSLLTGRLATVPQYDDVSYFLDATRWLLAFPSRSIGESLHAMLVQHAPFATAMAVLGFLLVPDGWVGPYAMNALVVALLLAGCARLLWHLPLVAIAAGLVGLACAPLLIQLVAEARPDLPWGLALGFMLVTTVHRPLLTRTRPRVFLIGLLAGAAAIIKPTALLASLGCVVLTLGIALVCDLRDEGRPWRTWIVRSWQTAGSYLAGFALAVAPIVMVQSEALVTYILDVVAHRGKLWRYDGNVYQHLKFYFWMLERAFGAWLWVGIALIAARLAISFWSDWRDFRRALALLAVMIATYAVPTLLEVKAFYFGGAIYGVFIVAMAVNFAAVFDRVDRAVSADQQLGRPSVARRYALGAMLALPVLLFALEARSGRIRIATVLPKDTIEDITNATARVWDYLRRHATATAAQARQPVTVIFPSPYPVNPSIIQLYAAQVAMPLAARQSFYQPTLESATTELLASDYGVVSSSISHNLPGPRMGDDIIRALDANPGMCLVDSISGANGGVVHLYRNRRLGCPPARDSPQTAR